MEEKWKAIPGYQNYQVSNIGRVKSIERNVKGKFGSIRTIRERILKPVKNKFGYLTVNLYNGCKAKNIKIHRLVAAAFVQNNSLFNNEVNHIDECKTNNCASNLEWCTAEQNCNFGTRNERIAKANKNNIKYSKPVKCIDTGKIYPSLSDVQRQLGFNSDSISRCCKKKQKTSYKYRWEYV